MRISESLGLSFLIGLLHIIFLTTAASQGQVLKGQVIDEAKQPLVNAYIYTAFHTAHTHSNIGGYFELSGVVIGDTLHISYLGFREIQHVVQQIDFQSERTFHLEEENYFLDNISINNSLQAVSKIASIDLNLSPVSSSQDILRKVPGLIIAQHAGGGKAEQIFLRGFDLDHGTDIAITVDGLPVNMVSHAHGHGYADLHFVIPETIKKIDFGKGPYYTDHGNFNTAGYVDFQTKKKLDQSSIGFEIGNFNTFRTHALIDLLESGQQQNAFLATEYISSDGPFESPQDFHRFNILGKYNIEWSQTNALTIQLSRFQSEWNASGQIPQRLVNNGSISRFGAVDATEGGITARTNILINHNRQLSQNSFIKSKAFYSLYDFELYSNFTFFLEDPVNGDQIRQKEERRILGFESNLHSEYSIGGEEVEFQGGIGLRYDAINDNELSNTRNRVTTLNNIAFGNIDEANFFTHASLQFEMGKWFINTGLRLDYFTFALENKLPSQFALLSTQTAFVSPKFNILFNPTHHWQFYLKSGVGFHSNDTRVILQGDGRNKLPAAIGTDLGMIWKPHKRLWINTALWYLHLDQEFVYVGDAGIVEPSGKTRRVGIDVSLRYQVSDELYVNSDVNYAFARSIEEESGNNYIPLAPDLTASGGLFYNGGKNRLSGGISYRYIKDRPANESNTVIAEGYFITDVKANYRIGNISLGFSIENLFNQAWNEAQFNTTSRLFDETEPVEELHFTPGVPLFIKGQVSYSF